MQYSFNIRYFEVLLLRIFRIFAGRGAILWTGMSEVVRRQIGIFLVGQNIISQHHARRNQLDDAPLDQPFDLFGILELFADRHAFARSDQLG